VCDVIDNVIEVGVAYLPVCVKHSHLQNITLGWILNQGEILSRYLMS